MTRAMDARNVPAGAIEAAVAATFTAAGGAGVAHFDGAFARR